MLTHPTKYPDKVLIGGVEYKLEFKFRVDKANSYGVCDDTNKIIYLSLGQSHSELASTFIHECIHGMDKEYALKLTHKQVHGLEQAIWDFVFANSEILK